MFKSKTIKLILNLSVIISVIASILFVNLQVSAAQKSITETCVLSLAQTNWNRTCSVPRFDPALGQLRSVQVSINAQVDSEVQIENRDPQPVSITSSVAATLLVRKPDSQVILSATPSQSASDAFGSYDGVLDFGGTSGRVYSDLMASISNSNTLTTQSDLDQFTGLGNSDLAVSASGQSSFTGSANYVSSVDTSAQASIEVTYFYIDTDLSVNKTHVGNFTAGQNATYTLTVNNQTNTPTTDPITLVDTLPNGMSYVSMSDPAWSCTVNGQIVTCVTNDIIPANSSISFDMVVSVGQNTSTNTLNQASVSTLIDDITPADNTTTDSAIVNHAPTANNNSINNIINALATVRLPDNTLSGNPNDANDSIQSYTIATLPNPATGLLYLGNPATGGTLITANQVLNPADLSNIYFSPVFGYIGESNFTYFVSDSFGLISADPATITLNSISLPGSPTNITTNPAVNSNQNFNSTQQPLTVTPSNGSSTTPINSITSNQNPVTASTTQVNSSNTNSEPSVSLSSSTGGEVLGVSDSVSLIRTGGNIGRIDQLISIFLYVALMASIYFFVKNWIEL